MRYYIISGEASGDLHGANLIKAIAKKDKDAHFRAWGGNLMESAGATLVKHYKDLAFMGFWEVIKNLKTILNNIKFCKQDILQFKPNVVILIDYPGFNLKIAKFLKKQNIKCYYYISPQVWAWHASRTKLLKAYVDKMFVILPFEKDYFKTWNYEVEFVGHPLLDSISQRIPNANFRAENKLSDKPLIAIIPGSRKQEINKMLPTMLQLAKDYKSFEFIIAGVNTLGESFYKKFNIPQNVKIIYNQIYAILEHAHTAVVTSGTATLETALFEVPEVICYKGNIISYLIAKQLVDLKYICLVNLILDKPVVDELIQGDYNYKNLKSSFEKIIHTGERRQEILNEYKILKDMLGNKGASEKTATLMLNDLKNG